MRGILKLSVFVVGAIVLSLLLVFVRNRYLVRESPYKGKVKQEQPAKPEAGKMPSDQNAFYGTYRITDPGKKIEALEKFILDFPHSSQIGSAKRELFKATVKKWPKDEKKILAAADRVILAPADVGERVTGYAFLAGELLSAGMLLDEAAQFAVKSHDFNKSQFIESQKKQYAEWKREIPSDEVMDKKYVKERAAYRATLGRIYLKQGKTTEGEKVLREAYGADPMLSPAAVGLAEIAEKKGDSAAALDYLTTATLTAGYTMKDVRSRFEALYRKAHSGSIQGIEAMLDARYKKLFPNPIKAELYKPASLPSDRVVLAESFTGAG